MSNSKRAVYMFLAMMVLVIMFVCSSLSIVGLAVAIKTLVFGVLEADWLRAFLAAVAIQAFGFVILCVVQEVKDDINN